MPTPRILIVLTSHDTLGETGKPTGFWLEEFAAPYYLFADAEATVTLASIQGGQPPIDPKSDDEAAQTEATRRFQKDAVAQEKLAQTLAIATTKPGDYDAIFLSGGHGTMWDFPSSSALTHFIEVFDQEEKVIAAVCHAPAALVTVKTTSGEPLVKGKRVTAFTNREEKAVELEDVVPFLPETRLKELGGVFASGEDWTAFIQQDGHLITGQNPASSELAAKAVMEMLDKRK